MIPSALITSIGLGSFSCLYGLTRKATSCSSHSANALVSGAHALLMILAGFLTVMQSDYWKLIGTDTPNATRMVLAFTLGYFIYDMIICFMTDLYTGHFNLPNLLHHAFAIIGTASSIRNKLGGTEVLVSIFYAELSTPFLHARTLLKEQRVKNNSLILITEALFALTFTFFRIFICPFLTYETLRAPKGDILVKITGAGLQLLSFYWFHLIMGILWRKIRRKKDKSKNIPN